MNKIVWLFSLLTLSIVFTAHIEGMDEKSIPHRSEDHFLDTLFRNGENCLIFLNNVESSFLTFLILELRYAKTGSEAVKNLYSFFHTSKQIQEVIHKNGITNICVKFILTNYYADVNEKLVTSLARVTQSKLCDHWHIAYEVYKKLFPSGNVESNNTPLGNLSKLPPEDSGQIVTCFRDETGKTLLHKLLSRGCPDSVQYVELLLQLGAEVHVKDNEGKTPLHYVTSAFTIDEKKAIVELLIQYGADINAQDSKGLTLFQRAIVLPSLSFTRYLKERGATTNTVDKNNYSLLHRKVRYVAYNCSFACSLEDIKFLLLQDTNSNARDSNGETPLHIAVKSVGEKLANKESFACYGQNELAYQQKYISNNCNLIELLIKSGADSNSQNNEGDTPLHLAVRYNCPIEYILFLIKLGAKLSIENKEGLIPLDCVNNNNIELINTLNNVLTNSEGSS